MEKYYHNNIQTQLNIVFASDDNYVQPLAVSIYSLLDNVRREVKITILDGGISDFNKDKLLNIAKKFNTNLYFYKMQDSLFFGFPIIFHYSIAIYYRLILDKIFEGDLDKVLYLDCDILVLGDVSKLFDLNLDKFYLAAVKDNISEDFKKVSKVKDFDIKIKDMFNTGVLLLNLKKIRQDSIMDKSMKFIDNYKNDLTLPDQEALNFLCTDNWLMLDGSWNVQMDLNQQKLKEVNILHYTNRYKPWHAFYHNYYQKYYIKYLKLSWPNYKLVYINKGFMIKQILKYIPFSKEFIGFLKHKIYVKIKK